MGKAVSVANFEFEISMKIAIRANIRGNAATIHPI